MRAVLLFQELWRGGGAGAGDVHIRVQGKFIPSNYPPGPGDAGKESSLPGPCSFSVSILVSLVNRPDQTDDIPPPVTACDKNNPAQNLCGRSVVSL